MIRISVQDTVRWLIGDEAEKGGGVIVIKVNRRRSGRVEPRVKKRRPKQYPRMTAPRRYCANGCWSRTLRLNFGPFHQERIFLAQWGFFLLAFDRAIVCTHSSKSSRTLRRRVVPRTELGAEGSMAADGIRGANHFVVRIAVRFSLMALRLAIQDAHGRDGLATDRSCG